MTGFRFLLNDQLISCDPTPGMTLLTLFVRREGLERIAFVSQAIVEPAQFG
jgi:hypothetical protein